MKKQCLALFLAASIALPQILGTGQTAYASQAQEEQIVEGSEAEEAASEVAEERAATENEENDLAETEQEDLTEQKEMFQNTAEENIEELKTLSADNGISSFRLSCSVKKVKIAKIFLSGISKKIAYGKKISLKAIVSPSNATNKAVTWKSSNKKYFPLPSVAFAVTVIVFPLPAFLIVTTPFLFTVARHMKNLRIPPL